MEGNTLAHSMADRLRRFHAGTELYAWEWLGAHTEIRDGQLGTVFRVWAPHAEDVAVVTEGYGWLRDLAPMSRMKQDSSIWECFLAGVYRFDSYKFSIRTSAGKIFDKADPFAFHAETRPYNASKVYDITGYPWHDSSWMQRNIPSPEPFNIYEVHFGSWRVRDDCSFFSYREMADQLIPYVCDMGYTHVELLPVMEHPFDGSWGYQPLGWFAATSRYGTPYDFMYFIDRCHQAGLGVILDWTAYGFPSDAYGLISFDGDPCYECFPPETEMPFGMQRFNFSKGEVISFLLSSAMFWLSQYHADGLRVSSVQPILSFPGDAYGAAFLRMLCSSAAEQFPRAKLIASRTDMWHSVTKPSILGGLGFSHMWHDNWAWHVLGQLECLPESQIEVFTKWLAQSFADGTSERYILPLSHDMSAHGKGSLLAHMPGQYHEKFAHLRMLYAFIMALPGDKLLFMGDEFAQFSKWACHHGLDWSLTDYQAHRQMREYVRALNLFYRRSPSLWEWDSPERFAWIDCGTRIPGLLCFERCGFDGQRLLAVVNLTSRQIGRYTVCLDTAGIWREEFSSDSLSYGGSGRNSGVRTAQPAEDGTYCLSLGAAAYSVQFFRCIAD